MPDDLEPGARWIEEVSGAPVTQSMPLVGGTSSEVTRHELADGRSVVGRYITDTAWLEREPGLIDAEAAALRLLADAAFPAPRLIATAPARLAMTFTPGAMLITANQLRDRVGAIATVARQIHTIEVPQGHGLLPWRSWAATELTPPTWSDHGLWTEAIDAFKEQTTPTSEQPVLLHRDFHPLNLLWDDEKVNVVDWVNACIGHPHAELGHCRWNLTVLAGLDCANAFLQSYLADGETYDRYWDLEPAMSFLPGPIGGDGWRAVGRSDLTPPIVIERTEAFLRAALT